MLPQPNKNYFSKQTFLQLFSQKFFYLVAMETKKYAIASTETKSLCCPNQTEKLIPRATFFEIIHRDIFLFGYNGDKKYFIASIETKSLFCPNQTKKLFLKANIFEVIYKEHFCYVVSVEKKNCYCFYSNQLITLLQKTKFKKKSYFRVKTLTVTQIIHLFD